MRIAIWSGRVLVISGSVSRSVRSATDWFSAVIAGSSFIELIHVNVAEMHDLNWSLTTRSWTTG